MQEKVKNLQEEGDWSNSYKSRTGLIKVSPDPLNSPRVYHRKWCAGKRVRLMGEAKAGPLRLRSGQAFDSAEVRCAEDDSVLKGKERRATAPRGHPPSTPLKYAALRMTVFVDERQGSLRNEIGSGVLLRLIADRCSGTRRW